MSSSGETVCLNCNKGVSILSSSSRSSSTPTTSTSPTEKRNPPARKASPQSPQTLPITVENHSQPCPEPFPQSALVHDTHTSHVTLTPKGESLVREHPQFTSSPITSTSVEDNRPPSEQNFSLMPSQLVSSQIQVPALPQITEAPTPLPIAYIRTSAPLIYIPLNHHRGASTIEPLEFQLATGHSCGAMKRKWNTKLNVIGVVLACMTVGLTCVGIRYQSLSISKKG